MHILISNDDGYNALGLTSLVQSLEKQHHRISVVAPRTNMSGCGMALSLRKVINVEKVKAAHFIVDGTPADCVYLALHNLLKEPVDLVISGINNGANLADDIYYSGTFAAAMEARQLYLPSIALSVASNDVKHYDTAAYIAMQLANELPRLEYKSLISVLNVNVPDAPVADLRGFKATILGDRLSPVSPKEMMLDDGERDVENKALHRKFVLGPAGDFDRRQRNVPTDYDVVERGFVSVTPLSAKLENRPYLSDTQAWLDSL